MNEHSTQLSERQEREAIAAIESCPWGDMEGHIRSVEKALERALEATAEEFPLWEEEGEERYVDEFSVSEEDIAGMSAEWRLAYIARLLRSLALCYGVATAEFGDAPPLLLAEPNSPGGLLRALNDLIMLPVMEDEPDRPGSSSPPGDGGEVVPDA
jgi:hypothetical protein